MTKTLACLLACLLPRAPGDVLTPLHPARQQTQDIETMLADCGPIKRIDLIKSTNSETGAKHSRGFGFVTFALESDASKAVSIIHRKR